MGDSPDPLSTALAGTWELLDRVTRTSEGEVVPSDRGNVTAVLIYDGNGTFSAQFQAENRAPEAEPASGSNNTRTVGGYDAYFGRYVVDDASGTVTQTLEGALSAESVGQVLERRMTVRGDVLTIEVDTTTDDGRPALITLNWRRR